MTKRTAEYQLTLKHDGFTGGLKVAQAEVDKLGKELAAKLGPGGAVLEKLGPQGLAAAAGIGAVVVAGTKVVQVLAAATKEAAAYGGKINDLSLKTSITATALQKLEHGGRLSGASMEALTGAVNKMQVQLSKAPEGFAKLGFEASKLKGMEPDKAMASLATAISAITDPADQASAAVAAFGKGGLELLPLLKSGFEDAAIQAEHLGMVLSEDAVAALDEFGDATDTLEATWTGLWRQIGASIAQSPELIGGIKSITEVLGAFARGAEGATKAMGDYLRVVDRFFVGGNAGQMLGLLGGASHLMGAAPAIKTPHTFGGGGDGINFGGIGVRAELALGGITKELADARKKAKDATEASTLALQAALAGPAGSFGMDFGASWSPRSIFNRGNKWSGVFGGIAKGDPGDYIVDDAGIDQVLEIHLRALGVSVKATATWDQQLERLAHTMGALGPLTAGFVGKLAGLAGAVAAIGANVSSFKKAGSGPEALLGKLGAVGGIAAAGIGFLKGLFGGGAEKREEQKRAQDEATASIKALAERWEQFQSETVSKGAAGFNAVMAHAAAKTKLTAEELARLGVIGMGVFGSLRATGMSFVDAVREMGPALATLGQRQSEGNAPKVEGPFADLAAFAALVEANESLVRAAEGLGEALNGLRATGSLTAETFAAIEGQAAAMFEELTGKGFSTDQALAVMARTLFLIKEAAEKGGLAVDAETQKLIDMAESAGLFEDLKDPMEEMKDILNLQLMVTAALAKAFGTDLPIAVQKYIDKLNEIPHPPGPPDPTRTGDPDEDPERRRNALGGYYPARPGGVPALLSEAGQGEYVVPEGKVREFAARFGGDTGVLADKLDSIERLLRGMPMMMRAAVQQGNA